MRLEGHELVLRSVLRLEILEQGNREIGDDS